MNVISEYSVHQSHCNMLAGGCMQALQVTIKITGSAIIIPVWNNTDAAGKGCQNTNWITTGKIKLFLQR